MQNKPNLVRRRRIANSVCTRNYKNYIPLAGQKNKPNSNPIKPNLKRAKMNINSITTKDYRKKDDFVVRINKANSKPISEKPKMNVNLYVIEDYDNETAFRPKKTNPIQTQFQTGRPLMDSRNYKKYLTLSLEADRICCVPEIICFNRNNEKGFQTCL